MYGWARCVVLTYMCVEGSLFVWAMISKSYSITEQYHAEYSNIRQSRL